MMQMTNCPKCGGTLLPHTAGYTCNKCYAQFDIKGEEIYQVNQPSPQANDFEKNLERLMKAKYVSIMDNLGNPSNMPSNWAYCPHCGHKLE